MKHSSFRKWLAPLRFTPFHPQWFAFKYENERFQRIGREAAGLVLDIGAGQQRISRFLSPTCSYVSFDYPPSAITWYNVRPQIFGDGQSLPFADEQFDVILLLDVLEHLPRPEICVKELHRVLKTGGKAIIHVPFLYPLHDAPLDFQRWTVYGLRELAAKHDFHVKGELSVGAPVETAALMSNLAYSYTVLHGSTHRLMSLLLAAVLPLIVLFNNVWAWLLNRLARFDDGFMPHGYELLWQKRTL